MVDTLKPLIGERPPDRACDTAKAARCDDVGSVKGLGNWNAPPKVRPWGHAGRII